MSPRRDPPRKGFRARPLKEKRATTSTSSAANDSHIPTAPSWAREIIDAAMRRDRLRFDDNPGLTRFTRPTVLGEFWPIVFPADMEVLVSRIPGKPINIRARIPSPTRPVCESDRLAIESIAEGDGISMLIDFNKHPASRKGGLVVIDVDTADEGRG